MASNLMICISPLRALDMAVFSHHLTHRNTGMLIIKVNRYINILYRIRYLEIYCLKENNKPREAIQFSDLTMIKGSS